MVFLCIDWYNTIMTIQQAMLSAIKKLQKVKNPSPHLEAEVLLSFIAYLTGHKEFYGLDFIINKNVLIPRPETELLVEETIKTSRQLAALNKPQAICDIGTGSGCLAIALAKYLPEAKIYATDISKKALSLAKKNARTHKVLKKVNFMRGDLLRPLILKKIKVNIITANLPYLTHDELLDVRHEPKTALFGGKMGIELIERLLMQSPAVLNPCGTILLEIAPTQTKLIDYIVEQHLPGKKVSFIKDLAGRDRVVKIE
jgi:release factor glutamine methyltransferase